MQKRSLSPYTTAAWAWTPCSGNICSSLSIASADSRWHRVRAWGWSSRASLWRRCTANCEWPASPRREAVSPSRCPAAIMNDDILLVDDDPDTIKVLRRILADSGDLRFATNGEDALRLARETAPDLMLLDAEMPGLSGFQVFDALKAEPALADVAVIFVTSQSEV